MVSEHLNDPRGQPQKPADTQTDATEFRTIKKPVSAAQRRKLWQPLSSNAVSAVQSLVQQSIISASANRKHSRNASARSRNAKYLNSLMAELDRKLSRASFPSGFRDGEFDLDAQRELQSRYEEVLSFDLAQIKQLNSTIKQEKQGLAMDREQLKRMRQALRGRRQEAGQAGQSNAGQEGQTSRIVLESVRETPTEHYDPNTDEELKSVLYQLNGKLSAIDENTAPLQSLVAACREVETQLSIVARGTR